jgi:tetratricopeptide (TPR) repeat protein
MAALILSKRRALQRSKRSFISMELISRTFAYTLLLGLLILMLGSCSSIKRNEKQLAQGNYDEVVNSISDQLKNKPDHKDKKELIALLEKAYKLAVKEDKRQLKRLEAEPNGPNSSNIYWLYKGLDQRQDRIRPLTEVMPISASFDNYSIPLRKAKNSYARFLHNKAQGLLSMDLREKAREAYKLLVEVKKLQPDFSGIDKTLAVAKDKGTRHIGVKIKYEAGAVLPAPLLKELQWYRPNNLDEFWQNYYFEPRSGGFDQSVQLNINGLSFGPDQLTHETITREKSIEDGWEYAVDRYGNVVRDSLGQPIKVPIIKIVRATLMRSHQHKEGVMQAKIWTQNHDNGTKNGPFPLNELLVFDNFYARFEGDQAALAPEDLEMVNNKPLPFPTDAQMTADLGQQIKSSFTRWLKQQQ